MRAIVLDGYGDESVMRWGEAPDPVCGPGQVVLDVAATAVNRADIMQRRGHYPPPPGASELLGLECSGRVSEVGPGVIGWAAGDEVMALLPGGGYAEKAVVDARHLMPIPKPLSLEEAGAVPETFITAWLNLFHIGHLKPGQRVLIHGGSGGVGTSGIQLCAARGIETWTTAGTEARRARCEALGAHRAVDYHPDEAGVPAFVGPISEAGGADLILDVVGAKSLEANLNSLAADGQMIIIGLQGGAQASLPLWMLLKSRLRVMGSTLRPRSDENKAFLIELFKGDVMPLLNEGQVKPLISHRLPLSEAAEAHRLMADSGHFGKILLTTA